MRELLQTISIRRTNYEMMFFFLFVQKGDKRLETKAR